MGRVGKIVLVRTGVRGDPIELRLMVWFDFSVLFFIFFCSVEFARDHINRSCS